MNKEKKYGVWTEYFSNEYSGKLYLNLRLLAERETSRFKSAIDDGRVDIADGLTSQTQNQELDDWVAQNDDMLTALVQDLQAHILSVVQFALPAHDERQILFKDASEGLRFHHMEQPQGYKSTFVIPMFAHDIGRLLEGRFHDPQNNPHQEWIPHSQLSFLLLQKILEQPQYADMPAELKAHYLYAVLSHSGPNGESYMSRAVQTCDRMQLIGAEGFFRALSYGVCLAETQIGYPDDPSYQFDLPNMYDHVSVISILEYCARNMRENIGAHHIKWQEHIAVENVALLLAYCDGSDDLANRIFAPERGIRCGYGMKKGCINADVLEKAYALYEENKYSADLTTSFHKVAIANLDHAAVTVIASRAIEGLLGTAQMTPDMKRSLERAVKEMPEIERQSLVHTMMIANRLRLEQDETDLKVCENMESAPQNFIRAIAAGARKYRGTTQELAHVTAFSPNGIATVLMSMQPS